MATEYPSVRLFHAGDLDSWQEGSARGFDPGDTGRDTIFIVRSGGLHAYANSCPHWPETPLAWRKDQYVAADGRHIVCSAHGARFEIATGVCVAGPCIGQNLTQLTLTQTDDGEFCLANVDIANTRL